jgi:DUF1009 family protein
MKERFVLKPVVDYFETIGCHVRGARESFPDPKGRYSLDHKIELDLIPKSHDGTLSLKETVDLLTAKGFSVIEAEEHYENGPNPVYVSLIAVTERDSDA